MKRPSDGGDFTVEIKPIFERKNQQLRDTASVVSSSVVVAQYQNLIHKCTLTY